MKIRIDPLTKISDLGLSINSEKSVRLPDDKSKAILEQINAVIAEYRAKGQEIIVAQKTGSEVAISSQVTMINGKSVFFPEPNPVHLFYSNAVDHFENSKTLKGTFIDIDPRYYHEFFVAFNRFFNSLSAAVIMLNSAIEAFCNQHIPETTIEINGKVYTKKEIERFDLRRKIKEFLPVIYKIKFQITNPAEYQRLMDLEALRHDLIHLKTQASINRTTYEKLFATLLKFEPQKHINAAFVFMNAIHAGYLVEEAESES